MKLGAREDVLRGLILLLLGVSVALLIDYTNPNSAFCGDHSGCAELRASGFGYLELGEVIVPVPVLGVGAGLVLFVLAQFGARRGAAQALRVLSLVGAVLALSLLGLQVYMGSFCSLCLVVDVSMLGIAALAHVAYKARFTRSETGNGYLSGSTWWGLLGLSLLAPLLYPRVVTPSDVPAVIQRMYRPGEITVLEFFDFQCPHCRELSPRLKKLVEATPGAQLRLGFSPLPGNQGSHPAAAMTICAAEQGREFELAARYFKQQDFSEAALRATAHEVLTDREKFEQCLASPRPGARIESDTAAIREAGFVGLPTTYIGGTRILGADHDRVYEEALRVAQLGPSARMPGWLYWLCCLIAAGVMAYWGRSAAPSE